jgi:hypothetical protein
MMKLSFHILPVQCNEAKLSILPLQLAGVTWISENSGFNNKLNISHIQASFYLCLESELTPDGLI